MAFAAALSVVHSRCRPRVLTKWSPIQKANPSSYRIDDAAIDAALAQTARNAIKREEVPADMTAMIGYTRQHRPTQTFPKLWRTVNGSTARTRNHSRRDSR